MDTFKDFMNSNLLILMRGVSGSGKSTKAKKIQEKLGGVIFSTDDFFTDAEGNYKFNPRELNANHNKNFERTLEAMSEFVSPIIIDNTNLQAWEMKNYVEAANFYKYKIKIIDVDTPRDEIMKRQQSRVGKTLPPEIIDRMLNKYQRNLSIEDILNSEKP